MLRALDDASMLDRYIEIKAQISELQEELDHLKPYLLDALMDEPEQKGTYQGFNLLIQRRKSYAYSPAVEELEKTLKAAKEHERSAGLAEVVKDQAILVLKTAR
ncbi:MAG: hypothetical protein AAF564_24340 [Bacteroidota bacterium]